MASPMATVSSASASSVSGPAFLNAEYVVPAVVLAFVALNVGNDPKYAELRGALGALLRSPRQILPEALGLVAVGLAIAAGLLLSPQGLRAEAGALESLRAEDEYTFGLRRLWPVLLHPDSLLVMQQLLMGLGAMLFLARGACARGSGSLALALLLLTVAQCARTQQWVEGENYTPEGPLGYRLAAGCACVTLMMMLAAALRSVRSAYASGCSVIKGSLNLLLVLALCAWIASNNHLAASGKPYNVVDVMYSFVYVVELCAAPLLVVAACTATQEVANLGGAFGVLVLAQAVGMWWFLDFAALLQDPNSEDPMIQHDIKIKNTLKTVEHGHVYAVFAVSHAVRALSAAAACGGYAVLRLSRPDAVPAKIADAPNGVPLLRVETFAV